MNQQFTGIQILRFMAAMLVVVMHITQAISIHISGEGFDHYWADGSAGVDIFFVISGFVMALSVSNLGATRQARVSGAWIFIKRRFLRIVPLYWFYTLLKASLLLVLPSLAARSSLEPTHLLASLLFIPAISPWGLVEPTLPVGWTLNFEMLFYAVFALALALGAPRIRFCLLLFGLVFWVGRYAPTSLPFGFYGQSIIFEFIFGVCIAHLAVTNRAAPPWMGAVLAVTGLVLIFGFSWSSSVDRLVRYGIGAALLLVGVLSLELLLLRRRFVATLAFFGDASYSIYLSHTFVVPACVMAFRALGVQDSVLILVFVSTVVVFVGCMSYVWLERPMTTYLKSVLFKRPKLTPPPTLESGYGK